MNNYFHPAIKSNKALSCLALALAAGLAVSSAEAQVVTLTSGNSFADVDLGAQRGMYDWVINGQNQLNQQWFWYRVDGDPSGQHSINTIGAPGVTSTANTLTALYTPVANNFSLSLTYQLSGGVAGGNDWTSDISETITINNKTASVLSFHFYQYSDFNLGGTIGNETSTIFQSGGFFSKAKVVKSSSQLSETIDQPLADHAEADLAPNTLNRLNGGSPYTLDDVTSAGPDPLKNATWALEWDFTIDPNSSVDVIKDKKLSVAPVPEPGIFALVTFGLVTFALRRSRRSA